MRKKKYWNRVCASFTVGVLLFGTGFVTAPAVNVQAEDKAGYEIETSAGEVLIDENNFPDETFRDYVRQFDLDGNGGFDREELIQVTEINVRAEAGKGSITTLKGIEYFTLLKRLNCSNNQLTKLDVSNLVSLKSLRCDYNQLTDLDVGSNPVLSELYCYNNRLKSLDVREVPGLELLLCGDNQLTSLDVSRHTALKHVSCYDNQLTSLDVSGDPALAVLYCNNNKLMSLDVSENPALKNLNCEYNQLASLDISNNEKLNVTSGFDCSCDKNERTIYIDESNRTFDLSTLPGFEVNKTSEWRHATVNGMLLTVDEGETEVYYMYDCGRGYKVWFTLRLGEPMFYDVHQSDWYYDYVQYVAENNLMTGKRKGVFAPGENLVRAQFAIILHRMNETPEVPYTNRFPDVADGQWYTNAILWANSVGVVGGYNNGMFGPADNINREQMAVMMYRYANYMKYDTTQMADFDKFADAASVNSFATEAMKWAVGSGIITGKDNGTRLDPQGNATRAECATIIMRFREKYQ